MKNLSKPKASLDLNFKNFLPEITFSQITFQFHVKLLYFSTKPPSPPLPPLTPAPHPGTSLS